MGKNKALFLDRDEFAGQQVQVARVYYCPYHPVHGIGEYKCDSPDRKPNPGMLLQARADFDSDLASSIITGDKLSNVWAGKRAGTGTTILLCSCGAGGEIPEAQYHRSDSLEDIRQKFFNRIAVVPERKKSTVSARRVVNEALWFVELGNAAAIFC